MAGDVDDVPGADGELIADPVFLQFGVNDDRAGSARLARGEENHVLQRDGLPADFFPERRHGDFEMGRAGQQGIAAVEAVLGQHPVALRR